MAVKKDLFQKAMRQEAVAKYRRQGYGVAKIIELLEEDGITNKGKAWSRPTIERDCLDLREAYLNNAVSDVGSWVEEQLDELRYAKQTALRAIEIGEIYDGVRIGENLKAVEVLIKVNESLRKLLRLEERLHKSGSQEDEISSMKQRIKDILGE